MHLLRTCVFAAMCCPTASSQNDWVEVENPFPIAIRNDAIWDSVRGRVVLVARTDDYSHQRVIEWDGAQWIERPTPPSNSPPFRQWFEVAFDQARGETVMFGGYSNPNGWFADTWVWDGHAWEQRNPATAPPARSSYACGYDPIRERVVLFGGGSGPGVLLDDTWEWDGSNWIQMSSATTPPNRSRAELAWDPNTQQLIMFGGQSGPVDFDDTWAWDGTDWTLLNPANKPPAGGLLRMTTDWVRSLVIALVANGHDNDEVYTWDGSDWTHVPTTIQPNSAWTSILAFDGNSGGVVAAFGDNLSSEGPINTLVFDGTSWAHVYRQPLAQFRQMITDSVRDRIVMFSSATEEPTKSWEWDGRTWHPIDVSPQPDPQLRDSRLAFDRHRAVTVLFGGRFGPNSFRDETWEWDGANWSQRFPANSPSPRMPNAMGFDPIRNECVMFGGQFGLADTWTWDGTNWTERFPATTPPSGTAAMTWDAMRQRLVMVSWSVQGVQTWEWDGSDWTQVTTINQPPGGFPQALAFDNDRDLVVRYAADEVWTYDGSDWTHDQNFTGGELSSMAWDPVLGRLIAFHEHTGNLWVHGPQVPASAASIATGCSGTQGVPKLSTYGFPSTIVGSFAFDLVDARSSSPAVIQLGLGATPTAVPLGGCTLYAATPVHLMIPLGSTNGGGFASTALTVPRDTTLFGASFVAQGLVLDPGGAGSGLLAGSNGVRITVGF